MILTVLVVLSVSSGVPRRQDPHSPPHYYPHYVLRSAVPSGSYILTGDGTSGPRRPDPRLRGDPGRINTGTSRWDRFAERERPEEGSRETSTRSDDDDGRVCRHRPATAPRTPSDRDPGPRLVGLYVLFPAPLVSSDGPVRTVVDVVSVENRATG